LVIGRAARCVALKVEQYSDIFLSTTAKGFFHTSKHSQNATTSALQTSLLDIYIVSHNIWISKMGEQLRIRLAEQLNAYDWNAVDNFKSLWEAIKLSSDGETLVETTLPVYASHYLVNILSNLCVEVNRVSSFDLGKVTAA
jgi:hypothetical protein